MDAFWVKGLCCVYTECYLNPAACQYKELNQETATLHRFNLIIFLHQDYRAISVKPPQNFGWASTFSGKAIIRVPGASPIAFPMTSRLSTINGTT